MLLVGLVGTPANASTYQHCPRAKLTSGPDGGCWTMVSQHLLLDSDRAMSRKEQSQQDLASARGLERVL